MRLPRLFTTALWLAVTVASTAMVWTATSIVADDVTDRAAPVLAREDVVSELESSAPTATTIPSTTAPMATTSTAPSRGPATTTARPNAPLPTAPPPQNPQPAITTAPASPPTTTPTAPQPPATTRPAGPPTTQVPPRPTATYSTAGGVVRVSCNGFFIELVSAIPSNGYAVNVVAGGPVNVEVHFTRSGQDLSVKAVCFGQPIRYYEQNPPRPAP